MSNTRGKKTSTQSAPPVNEKPDKLFHLPDFRNNDDKEARLASAHDWNLASLPLSLLREGNELAKNGLGFPQFPFHITRSYVIPRTSGKRTFSSPFDRFLVAVKEFYPDARFEYIEAYSNVAKQYYFNGLLIDIPRSPRDNAFRYAIYVNYLLLVETLHFTAPGFESTYAKKLEVMKDRTARKILCHQFDIASNTAKTYVMAHTSISDVPSRPNSYIVHPELRGIEAGQRKWYSLKCEEFLVLRVSYH